MSDDLDAVRQEIAELRDRCYALECASAAHDAMFLGLAEKLGPPFLEAAAEIAERIETHPQLGGSGQQRMTEALRVIEQIRAGSYRKPKPGQIV